MSAPRVTAIVAAVNEERHIGARLASLLAPSYAPLEILVVDDGSRDRTAALAAAVGAVRVLRRAHEGKALLDVRTIADDEFDAAAEAVRRSQ